MQEPFPREMLLPKSVRDWLKSRHTTNLLDLNKRVYAMNQEEKFELRCRAGDQDDLGAMMSISCKHFKVKEHQEMSRTCCC